MACDYVILLAMNLCKLVLLDRVSQQEFSSVRAQEPSRISSVDRGACIKGVSQVVMVGTVCVNGSEYHRRAKC
jgi:hypothetical protein